MAIIIILWHCSMKWCKIWITSKNIVKNNCFSVLGQCKCLGLMYHVNIIIRKIVSLYLHSLYKYRVRGVVDTWFFSIWFSFLSLLNKYISYICFCSTWHHLWNEKTISFQDSADFTLRMICLGIKKSIKFS